MNRPITYLDHAASTPMRPEAVEAMLPFLTERYANPSGSHRFARHARQAVDESRDRVASVVGCHPNDVVFTGCGTESDNMSITGAVTADRRRGGAGVAVCSRVEHPAVLDVVEHHDGVVIGVDGAGCVDLDQLADVLQQRRSADGGSEVAIVSAMTVNNEVGSINDVAAVSALVRRHAPGALVHTDAVQAPSWVDLRTVTPHVDPLIIGGGQERGRRSGTHNAGGIVAAAVALELTDRERDTESVRIADLRDRLVKGLQAGLPDVRETLSSTDKVAGSAHVCIRGVESEALLYLLDEQDVCASAASACASGAMEPSHVLAAMGVQHADAMGALRLTLGHTTTADDVDRATAVIVEAVTRLRR